MIDLLTVTASVLADAPPRNTGPDFGKASPVGLVIVVVLLIGTFLLVWSMNRHLKKLPPSFDPDHPEPDQAVDEGTVDLDTESAPGNESSKREPGG